MADIISALFGINKPFHLTDIGDGSYALGTQTVLVGSTRGANDMTLAMFDVNLPIRIPRLADGTFVIGTCTPINPRPAADAVIGFSGLNLPFRLVGLGDGSYALGAVYQPTGGAVGSGIIAPLFGVNLPMWIARQSSGDYALVFSTGGNPRSALDASIAMLGINRPIRLVNMGNGSFALAVFDNAYIFRDEFTTAQSAPLTSPRTAEPGAGSWTITDTGSLLSITGGAITCGLDDPGTNFDTHKLIDTVTVVRATGRALFFTHHNGSVSSSIVAAGFNANSTLSNVGHTHSIVTSYNGANTIDIGYKAAAVPLAIDTSTVVEQGNTDYPYAIVLRSTGAFYFVYYGGEWLLLFVDTINTTTPLTMFVAFWRLKAANDDKYNDARLRDLGGVFTTDNGIATVNVTASSGVTQTADANGLYYLFFTLPAGSANLVAAELRYRQQDANNYWTLYVKRNAGNTAWDVYLDKVTAGTPVTQSGFPVTGVGTVDGLAVIVDSTRHNVFSKITTTWTKQGGQITDSGFQTATTINPQAGAGTTLGSLQCFPRRSALYDQLETAT